MTLEGLQMAAPRCPSDEKLPTVFKYCPTFLGHDNEADDYVHDDNEGGE